VFHQALKYLLIFPFLSTGSVSQLGEFRSFLLHFHTGGPHSFSFFIFLLNVLRVEICECAGALMTEAPSQVCTILVTEAQERDGAVKNTEKPRARGEMMQEIVNKKQQCVLEKSSN